MKIESRVYSKPAAKEFVRISSSSVKLVKNPNARLGDNLTTTLIALICCIVIFLTCIVVTNFVDEPLIDFWAGAFIVMAIFLINYRMRLKRFMSSLTSPNRLTVFELDKDGLEIDDSQKVTRVKWGAYKGYRVFKHTLVFIPKSIQGQMCVFQIERKEELERFFEENKIKMQNLG